MKYNSYCFGDFLNLRNADLKVPELKSESIAGDIQIDQMKVYAKALSKYSEDVLKDDHSIFPSLAQCIEKRVKQYKKERKNR